jgi:hypothetical protein
VDIVKLYLLFGAAVRAYKSRRVPPRNVWDIIKAYFVHLPVELVLELKRLIQPQGTRNLESSTPRKQLHPGDFNFSSIEAVLEAN